MTSKEALETVKDYLLQKLKEDNSELGSIIIVESVNVLEKLVERDTPMTPIFESIELICPKCKQGQHTNTAKYCSECGQRIGKLDWSELENE